MSFDIGVERTGEGVILTFEDDDDAATPDITILLPAEVGIELALLLLRKSNEPARLPTDDELAEWLSS